MSIELRLLGTSLVALTQRALREALRSHCPPPIPGLSIDHLEVVPGAGSLALDGQDVQVHLPVDVFVVTDKDLAAAPNAPPLGSATPAGRATFVFRLAVRLAGQRRPDGALETGTVLLIEALQPDLGLLGARLGADADTLGKKLQNSTPALEANLAPQLALLGMPLVTIADIVMVGSVVAVRFGPAGAPQSRLFPGQQWGLFIDGPGMEQLLRSQVAPKLQSKLPGATVSATYAAAGLIPHVDLAVETSLSLAAIDARIVVDMPTNFSLVPGASPVLRATVNWSTHVYANSVFSWFEGIAEGFIEDEIRPADYGGQSIGDHVFVIDNLLPPIPLLGVTFRYDNLFGSPAGMTIGGRGSHRRSRPTRRAASTGRATTTSRTVSKWLSTAGAPASTGTCPASWMSAFSKPARQRIPIGRSSPTRGVASSFNSFASPGSMRRS